MAEPEAWHPGSFTKNFSWGPPTEGLRQLHEAIRVGFDNRLEDTSRDEFRFRVSSLRRPDFIPINFFLFNQVRDGKDWILVDELVFQALSFDHSDRFDIVALQAFHQSLVGRWRGARPYQSTPALWAKHYLADRIGKELKWNTPAISADDIERFVSGDKRYRGQTARKLATNLNYLYSIVDMRSLASPRIERWWVDSVFTALDRVVETRRSEQKEVKEDLFSNYLMASGFNELSPRSLEKDLALGHLTRLYRACGGRQRFSEEDVRIRQSVLAPELPRYIANNTSPILAVHPSNPRIMKGIPRVCAMLARYAGFELLDVDALTELDISEFITSSLSKALTDLDKKGVSSKLSAEELMRLLRGK